MVRLHTDGEGRLKDNYNVKPKRIAYEAIKKDKRHIDKKR
jgi:hypothetical protein